MGALKWRTSEPKAGRSSPASFPKDVPRLAGESVKSSQWRGRPAEDWVGTIVFMMTESGHWRTATAPGLMGSVMMRPGVRSGAMTVALERRIQQQHGIAGQRDRAGRVPELSRARAFVAHSAHESSACVINRREFAPGPCQPVPANSVAEQGEWRPAEERVRHFGSQDDPRSEHDPAFSAGDVVGNSPLRTRWRCGG